MNTQPTNRKPTARDRADDFIREIAGKVQSLDGWNSFVETLTIPQDLMIPLITGRDELVTLATPRAMTAEETAQLYKAIGVLIRTNMALRDHAQEVAIMVGIWSDAFKQLHSLGTRIDSFAHFRTTQDSEDAEEPA